MGRNKEELLSDAQIEEKCKEWAYFEDLHRMGSYDNLFKSIAAKCDGRQTDRYWTYRKLVPSIFREKFDMCYIECCKKKDKRPKRNTGAYVQKASEIKVKPVHWLWYPYIPRGKVTIIAGPQGTGKTFLMARLAQIVSTGSPFPFSNERRPPGKVLFINAEDGAEDTIRPRLEAAGADLKLVDVFRIRLDEDDELKDFDFRDPLLLDWMEDIKPDLVVFDPFQCFMPAKTDLNRSNETRPVLAYLGRVAEEYDAAIVIVAHLNKMGNASFLTRVLGSTDITAAVRSVIGICPHPKIKDDIVFSHEKANLALKGESLVYQIVGAGAAEFYEKTPLTADDCLMKQRKKQESATMDAAALIRRVLEEEHPGEWVEARTIYNKAAELGIGERTVRRAAEDIPLKKQNAPKFGKSVLWMMGEEF